MGGSSGSSSQGNFGNHFHQAGPGASGSDNCNVVKEITLQGTKLQALTSLSVGQDLDITLRTSNGVKSAVCVTHTEKSLVGSIAYNGVSVLIACIESDNAYVATITFMLGGRCDVRIRRV